jgi:hypothetical protein
LTTSVRGNAEEPIFSLHFWEGFSQPLPLSTFDPRQT